MSSPQGLFSEFVDTQDVELENITDGIIYTQVKTILPFEVSHQITEHNTCTGFVEKLTTLDNVKLDCRAILTEPDLPALMTLSLVVNSKLPLKLWIVSLRSFSNLTNLISGDAKMFNFKILDRGADVVLVEFTLEFESDIANLDTDVIAVQ